MVYNIRISPTFCEQYTKGIQKKSLICNAVISVLSRFAIILLRKRELVALVLYSYCCMNVYVLCRFLTEPWVGLWSVIVAIRGHTYLFLICSLLTHLTFCRQYASDF